MFKDIDINEIEKLKKDKELLSLKRAPTNIKERFGQSNKDILDEEFKQKTVGLVTREEFKRKRENIDNLVVADMKQKEEEEQRKKLQLKQKRKEEIHKKTTLLSFDLDEEQQQQNESGYGKDTTVDTTYLPDMNREKKIEELTKKYQEQYLQEVQNQKASFIDIKFQYWEASSGVKTLRIKKSTTVLEFVELARKEIIRDFGFLREFSPDDLIIVANEMILPHKLSFYDLIAYKVKNRSENLIFNFERVKVQVKGQEYEVEIEKSTTVRIIEKYKYEKIKHIYPCSIWENVDMSKYL